MPAGNKSDLIAALRRLEPQPNLDDDDSGMYPNVTPPWAAMDETPSVVAEAQKLRVRLPCCCNANRLIPQLELQTYA